MNKILIIISFFLLFLTLPVVNASGKDLEEIKIIEFNNLTSKDINYVFKNLDISLIEIEIKINNIVKIYRVDIKKTNNLERELTKRIVKSLEEDNLKEMSAIASIKGFRINKIKLRCNKEIENIIKDRTENL